MATPHISCNCTGKWNVTKKNLAQQCLKGRSLAMIVIVFHIIIQIHWTTSQLVLYYGKALSITFVNCIKKRFLKLKQ